MYTLTADNLTITAATLDELAQQIADNATTHEPIYFINEENDGFNGWWELYDGTLTQKEPTLTTTDVHKYAQWALADKYTHIHLTEQ